MANNKLQPEWTKEQEEWLLDNLNKHTNKELVILFEQTFGFYRTKYAICHKYMGMGLKKENDGRFQKNNTPFNKGLPQWKWLTEENIEKIKNTQFKKGQKGVMTKPKGYLSLRRDHHGTPYWYIKVNDLDNKEHLNWKLFHRYIWENLVGEIPKDKIVIFKDGDTNNVDLSNLMLISKGENATMNKLHYRTKYADLTETNAYIVRLNQAVKRSNND